MPKSFLPLGPWVPDGPDRDTLNLDIAKNVLPVFGQYRPIRDVKRLSISPSDVQDPEHLTGGIGHLIDNTQAVQGLAPDSDSNVGTGYSTSGGAVTNLFQEINTGSPDPFQFVFSRTDSTSENYLTTFDSPTSTPITDTNHKLLWQFEVFDPNSVGWQLIVDLFEGGSPLSTPVTKTVTGTGSQSGLLDFIALTTGQAAAITDYTDLEWRHRGFLDSAPVSSRVFPNSTVSNLGGWDKIGSTEEFFDLIDDFTSDTIPDEVMESGILAVSHDNLEILFGLPTATDPISHDGHSIEIRAKGQTAACQVKVEILEPGDADVPIIIVTHTFTLTTSFVNYSETLTAAEVALIESYSGLQMRITAIRTSSDTTCRVSAASFTVPDKEGISVSWVQMQVSTPNSVSSGDIFLRYVGNRQFLFEIDETSGEWTDRSIAGNYTPGTVRGHSWSMTSYGPRVIATNWIDQVQKLDPGDALFSNLITSTDKPTAKSAIVVQNFLVLANINPTSFASGEANLVWWSAIDNSAIFEQQDPATQSNFYFTRLTPGEILGAVGGEFGLLFKRNSVIRMNYIGPPFVFGFDVLSYTNGTAYPRSIVPVGQDVYYISNGKIMLIRQGTEPVPVGRGKVLRHLFDAEFEDEAIDQRTSPLRSDIDSTVIGAYDSYSNHIWWMYRVVGANYYQSDFFIIYSIDEDRFTHGQFISPDSRDKFDHILGDSNTVNDSTSITKGITVFSYDDSGTSQTEHAAWTLSSNVTMAITFKSKILSSNFIAKAGEREANNIQINNVRLLYRTSDGASLSVPVTITLVSSEEPNMLASKTSSALAVSSEKNQDEWYPVQNLISGGYFTYQIDIPEITGGSLREISGLGFDWEEAGEL